MGTEFEIVDAVSTPATLTRAQKAELSKLAVLKCSSVKREIYEAIERHLSLEENQKILKGEKDERM
jgi:hypothetical protein